MPRSKEQLAAIHSTGNIIVSAGAGSGKTSVLTERIVTNICKEDNPVKLDEILILTFANDAANEMRTRLKQELGKKPETINLVPLVDSANICTFDAYFLYLVKKYASRIGISNNISQIPDDIIYVKKNEVLEGFISKIAENPSEIDQIIFDNYCKKNYKSLIKVLIEIDRSLEGIVDFDSLILKYKNEILTEENFVKFRDEVVLEGIKSKFKDVLELRKQVEDEKYLEKLTVLLQPVIDNPTWDNFTLVFGGKFRVPANNKKALSHYKKEKINKILKSIAECFKNLNYDERIDVDLKYNKIVIPYLLEIVKNLEIEITKFKHDKGAFTFFDIANMAFNLLRDNEDIRLSIKNKLKLIMIDEYQDTSVFQEEFINMISNNNVFVVGDVKQSIYGFRDANPQQFIDKYDNYHNHVGGEAIDMNTNYRSRVEITDTINDMFKEVMTLEYGGAQYNPYHIIGHGNTLYDIQGKTDNKHGIFRLNYFKHDKNINDINTKNEIDAIIKNIKVRVQTHMQVFDRSINKLRDCSYKDFAILVPAATLFKKIEQRFNQSGIPINAVYDEDIRSDDGVIVLINILKLINAFNGKDTKEAEIKHSMLSVLRSFLYAYPDQKIYEFSQDENYKKCPEYLFIQDFAKRHADSLIHDTYMDVLKEFDYLDKLSRIGNVINKLKFNKVFFERTQIMDDFGYNLNDFIQYLSLLDELDLQMESRTSSDVKDAVTLTTIHKSKGLQYGIVYMPFAWRSGAHDVVDFERFFINKKFGIALPSLVDKDNKSFHSVFSKFYIKNSKASELIRLLYVALTRAQEEVCILQGIPFIDPDAPVYEEEFTDVMEENPIEGTDDNLFGDASEEDLRNDALAKISIIGNIFDVYGMNRFEVNEYQDIEIKDEKKTNEVLTDKKIEISDFRYVFKPLEAKKRASKVLSDLANVGALKYGTHLHLLLEAVNFKTKDTSFIKSIKERNLIDSVLQNPIFDNLENAKFYKEYEYFDDKNNMTGIIDLLIINGDEAIIIDYKTKNISDSAYDNQLNIYKDYIERVFKMKTKCYLLSIVENKIREI